MKRLWSLGDRLFSSRLITALVVALIGGAVLWRQQAYQLPPTPAPNSQHTTGAVLGAHVARTHAKPINCHVVPCLALSFDDGPNAITTPQLLAALEAEDVPATFFVVGRRIAGQEALLRQMYNDGDEIGNHSWSHPDFTKLHPQAMIEQIKRTETAVITAGLPPPRLFRPPYGAVNKAMLDTIHAPIIMWNIDPADWDQTDPAKLKDLIQHQARAGGIMVLHDNHNPTAQIAREVIHNLKKRFKLVTVSQLLDLPPDARGEFFGRILR
jgi:peptidoglycan/xylan/chitin deacetylase (PgdA/CDA1 family)